MRPVRSEVVGLARCDTCRAGRAPKPHYPARTADTARLSRRPRADRLTLAVLCVTSLLAANAAAQAVTGTILGTVKDATGGVIPGTLVTFTQSSTGLTRSVATDGNGEYAAPLLATGVYTLRLERSGYKTASVTGVELGVDRKVRVDLTLEIGELTDSITVKPDQPAGAAVVVRPERDARRRPRSRRCR